MMTEEQLAEFRRCGAEDDAAKRRVKREAQGRLIRGLTLPAIVFFYQVLVNGSVSRGLILAVATYLYTWGGYIFGS